MITKAGTARGDFAPAKTATVARIETLDTAKTDHLVADGVVADGVVPAENTYKVTLPDIAYDLDNAVIYDDYNDNEVITGTSGNDILDGRGGNDIMSGGNGDDTMYGGYGDDTMVGGVGNDWMEGGYGHDWIIGDGGNDTIYGGYGNDTIEGRDGNDRLIGEGGSDVIKGGAGNDVLIGGGGTDYMTGGTGKDTFAVGNPEWTGSGFKVDKDIIGDFEVADGHDDAIGLQDVLSRMTDFYVRNPINASAQLAFGQGYVRAIQQGQPGDANYATLIVVDSDGIFGHKAADGSFVQGPTYVVAELVGVTANQLSVDNVYYGGNFMV